MSDRNVQLFKYYIDQMEGSTLERLTEAGAKMETYWLRKSLDSTMMSTFIVFIPYGIIITGDLRPEGNGVIAPGYDREWFSGHLDYDYMASKFLKQEWVPDRMKRRVEVQIKDWETEIQTIQHDNEDAINKIDLDIAMDQAGFGVYTWNTAVRSSNFGNVTGKQGTILDAARWMLNSSKNLFEDPHTFYDAIPGYQKAGQHYFTPLFDSDYMSAGYGYPDHKVGWLVSIQHHFARLIPGIALF